MSQEIELSAIVPVGRRYDDTGRLLQEYLNELHATGTQFELICVLDGVHIDLVERMAKTDARVRIVQLAKEFGEATALTAGLEYSSGQNILTLPAYFQIVPSEIHHLLDQLQFCDVAVGVRWPRAAKSVFERARRKLFHWLVSFVTGDRFSDLGCGARALKRVVLEEVPLYGDQHRFLPILAARRGFRVNEIQLTQSAEDRHDAGYGARVYLRRLLDIFTVFFLVRFTKKPLRFFGSIGSIMFVVGGVFLTFVIVERVFFGVALADRPALLLSSLLVVLGLQLFALGLLGELIIFTHAREIKEYSVERIVN